MPLILALETSSVNCSVSIFDGLNCMASKEMANGYSHAENLHLFIQEVMHKASLNKNDLSAVIVGAGPGSFTGLRIGVSSAKGLCYALSIPLLSMPSLENMAHMAQKQTKEKDALLCPLIDARRMEVYSSMYDYSLNRLQQESAFTVDESTFLPHLEKNKVCFFGDGMKKIRDFYASNENAIFLEDIYPSSTCMASTALKKIESKEWEDTAYFEPFYLKKVYVTTPKKKIG